MGIQDRDYAKERKLDYSSKYDAKKKTKTIPVFQEQTKSEQQNIPQWAFVVCGLIAVGLILYIGATWN